MKILDFGLTGDYQLNHILFKNFSKEYQEGYQLKRINYSEFVKSSLIFKRIHSYKMSFLPTHKDFPNFYLLDVAVDDENKTVVIHMDTEN